MKFKATIILFIISLGFSINSYADGFCEGPLGSEKAIESAAGVITYSGAVSGIGDCDYAPDEYTVTIYEMGICTSSPTAPTASSAYETDTCSTVINTPAGQTINLASGSEIVLTGLTRPPNGTYTHAYMLLSNSFGIKVTKQFTNTMFQNNTANSGNFCWTLGGTQTNSDYSDGSPPSAAASPSAYANCGAEADAAPATYTEVLDEFDSSGESQFKYGPVSVESGSLTAYLVANSDSKLVAADNTADRLFGMQTLTTSSTVTTDSTAFVVSFGVNQATAPQMIDKGVTDQYRVISFASGPFSAFITVE